MPWSSRVRTLILISLLGASGAVQAQGITYGLGRAPTAVEVKAWDFAINPDGRELPEGSGTAAEGGKIYAMKCIGCHGPEGSGGAAPRLIGRGTATAEWPFATSLWDYIYRAMPLFLEGSLTHDEVYSLTAYLLSLGKAIDEDLIVTRDNLAGLPMPNREGYVPPPIEQWEPGMPRLFTISEP